MDNQIQRQLFDRIRHRFPRRADLVNELSNLLNVGRDAIYRRLRGDTLLTPDEIVLIAKTFKISLDALVFNQTDAVFFTFNAFSQEIQKVEDYLYDLKNNLHQYGSLPDNKVFFASSEIPIFYYCLFPKLMNFKLYVWGRTVWNLSYLQQEAFHFNLIDPYAIELGLHILEAYIDLDTTEFWSLNTLDKTLNQIEYHLNSGQFKDPKDALELCDVLEQLVEHLGRMAVAGKKFMAESKPEYGTSFNLFHNEMIFTNNTIYLTSPHMRVVFSTFGNPNYLKSTDPRLCDFIEIWFKSIQTKSSPISTNAEKARNWYFNTLKRKIDFTRRRMELVISEEI